MELLALEQPYIRGDHELTEALPQYGAEVNLLIPGIGTPIRIACGRRDEGAVKLLLTRGADVHVISPNLGSALHVACKFFDSGLVRILLQHGANVNVFSSNYGTPLHTACTDEEGNAIVQLLLEHGADVNLKGSKGETPLTSILLQSKYFSRRLIDSLLGTEQRLYATENDLNRLLTRSLSSKTEIQICKLTHLQPTSEPIRSVLDNHEDYDSNILRLILAKAPHLEITLEIIKMAKSRESVKLLTQHGSSIKITANVMEGFIDPLKLDLIQYCLESAPEVIPPRSVVTAIRAILKPPELKSDESRQVDSWGPILGHSQRSKEIMELILARHPDIEALSSMKEPKEFLKTDTGE